jgi:phage terminase Nu1 subunit (DNA packaging protein)
MDKIIVSRSDIASIFAVDERTVSKLALAGLLIKVSTGKYDLIASTTRYTTHLREMAAGITTRAPKEAALVALTTLREAQRKLIEQKSRDYVRRDDVKKLAAIAGATARNKLCELPRRLRQKIEDDHPTLIASLKEALALEDDIEAVCFEVMQEIADTDPAFGLELVE